MELNFDQWIKIVTLLLACIGGWIALAQWRHTVKIKRAEFINQIIEKLRFNDELSKTIILIDYNESWYDNDFHGNEDGIEYKIDRLFSYLSYICYQKRRSVISDKEFKCLQYELNRICYLPDTQAYLWNLHHFSQKHNTACSFHEMIEYAFEQKLLPKGFFNNHDDLFDKRLNF